MSNIFKLEEYILLTFASTHVAMAAEQLLLQQGFELLVIPIPREVSNSCGLAIKLFPKDSELAIRLLRQRGLNSVTIYDVSTVSGQQKQFKQIETL